MKKFIIATLLMFTAQATFAQLETTRLAKEYNDMFILAERVAEQTDNVIAEEEEGVGFVKGGKKYLLQKVKDKRSNVNAQYLFKLVKPDGNKIPLSKEVTEKVIKKFNSLLLATEESLKEEHASQVEDILGKLFAE